MLKITGKSILIHSAAPITWEAIYNVNCWKGWNPAIQRVALLETPKTDAIGSIHTAKGSSYPFKITRVTAGTFLEWQREYELGTVLAHSYSVTKNAEGSVFTIELFCSGNMANIVAGIMRNGFIRNLEEQLIGFQHFCENPENKGSHDHLSRYHSM